MNPSPRSEVAEAAARFEEFTGHKHKVRRAQLDKLPAAAYKLGQLVGVAYEAKRDGKTDKYYHPFKKSVRPELLVSSDGNQLLIHGGRFRVTDHGIVDD